MANAITFLRFNDHGRTVTPTFLSRDRFYLQLSLHCPKMNKKSMWEVKKILRFLSTRHRNLPSCGCKACEIVAAKCELVLQGTSPVDLIRLIVPFKPYLAENISLQRCNCKIFGLTATVTLFGKMPDFSDLGCSSRHVISKTKSVTTHFFAFLTSLTHHLSMVKFSEKNQC